MKQQLGTLIVLAFLLALGPSAVSADIIPDTLVAQFDDIARDHITSAVLRDGSHVKPETPAERAVPLIPQKHHKCVVEHGAKTALIESCGLEWRPIYIKFMADERKQYHWSDKQSAYMGMLHGISQGFFYKDFAEKGCSAEMKSALRQKLGL